MQKCMLITVQVAVLRDQSCKNGSTLKPRPYRTWSGGMVMASFHVIAGASETLEHTKIRKIGVSDLFDALRRGVDDFMVKPSHIVFLCLIYPLVGIVLAVWT